MVRAAAVVVGFNFWYGDTLGDKTFTRDFIRELTRKNPELRVLLIDNDSDKPYPSDLCEVIRIEHRVGYAAALNVGLRWLAKGDYDWYITFNNDNWIDALYPCDLLKVLETLDPNTLYGSGWNLDVERKLKWQFSAWLAISRRIFMDVGYFDAELDGAFEDFDYERRAQMLGYKLDTAPFRITHMDEHTRRDTKDYEDRWEASRQYFMRKHGMEMDRWFRIAKTTS